MMEIKVREYKPRFVFAIVPIPDPDGEYRYKFIGYDRRVGVKIESYQSFLSVKRARRKLLRLLRSLNISLYECREFSS